LHTQLPTSSVQEAATSKRAALIFVMYPYVLMKPAMDTKTSHAVMEAALPSPHGLFLCPLLVF
jgi:hypothetical protein